MPLKNPTISKFCDGVGIIAIPNIRTAINDFSQRRLDLQGPCNPENSPSAEGIEEHVFEAEIDLNKAPYDAMKKQDVVKYIFM